MRDDVTAQRIAAPWPPLAGGRRYRRTAPPAWAAMANGGKYDWPASELWLGEQAEWGWALPWLWEQLRDPHAARRAPATPKPGCDPSAVFGYWVPLLHLARYALGWARLDQGLAAWLMAGRPTPSPTLRLLNDLWARDGQLEYLVAWLALGSLAENANTQSLAPSGPPTAVNWAQHRDWLDVMQAGVQRSGHLLPLGEGDPLHLSGHCEGPLVPPQVDLPFEVSVNDTVVLVEGGKGWYFALGEVPWAVHSQVDVVSRSLGWLGTFRRSPESGRWYRNDVDPYWHLAGC